MNNNSKDSLTPDLDWDQFHQEAERLRQEFGISGNDAIVGLEAQLLEEQNQKQARYEAEVSHLVQQTYPLTAQDETTLETLRQNLGLGEKTAQRIRNDVVSDYEQNLQEYRSYLTKAIQDQYPFNEEQKAFLERRQRFLNLSPQVAQILQQEVLANIPGADLASPLGEPLSSSLTIASSPTSTELLTTEATSGLATTEGNPPSPQVGNPSMHESITASVVNQDDSLCPNSQNSFTAAPATSLLTHEVDRSSPEYWNALSDGSVTTGVAGNKPESSIDPIITKPEVSPTEVSIAVRPPEPPTAAPRGQRSQLIPVAIGGGLLLALLTVVGVVVHQQIQTYRTMQAALTEAENQQQAGNYQGCISSATIVSTYSRLQSEADAVLKDCQEKQRLVVLNAKAAQDLQQAKERVKTFQLREAVDLLRAIPSESDAYDKAQALFKDLSGQMLKIAEDNFQVGKIKDAEAIVSAIPETSPVYPQAKSKLAAWQKTWQENDKLLKAAEKARKEDRLPQAKTYAQKVTGNQSQQKQAKSIMAKVDAELARRAAAEAAARAAAQAAQVAEPQGDQGYPQGGYPPQNCTTWPEVDPRTGEMRPVTRCR